MKLKFKNQKGVSLVEGMTAAAVLGLRARRAVRRAEACAPPHDPAVDDGRVPRVPLLRRGPERDDRRRRSGEGAQGAQDGAEPHGGVCAAAGGRRGAAGGAGVSRL